MQSKLLFRAVILLSVCIGGLCISCYSCTYNANDVYDARDGWCANDTLYKMPKKDVIRPCAHWETKCSTTIMTTLKSFTSITRGCAIECSSLCDSEGYGSHQVTCHHCCTSDLCNNDTSVNYYLKVMNKQYTNWENALADEVRFNRDHKLKFPY